MGKKGNMKELREKEGKGGKKGWSLEDWRRVKRRE